MFRFILVLLLSPLVMAHLSDDIDFDFSSAKLPFPLSDMMANFVPNANDDEGGVVIITGGCNSEKGNERLTIDGDNGTKIDLFACVSTNSIALQFDPFSNTFTELASAPNERQRHAAVVHGGEVWVLGGRDSNDELVTAIDSFNPSTNTWTTRGQLPDDLVTSDLTAWVWQHHIYVTGGFQADYNAVGTTYRLDVSNNPMSFESMQLERLATSRHPRGDVHAVELFGYAYIAGGLSHTSMWCEGLKTTERYHMATDAWEMLADLNIGRADMAVASLNNRIVAMGGETKPEDCQTVQDPAYGSFPADHVEVLLNPDNTASNPAKWMEFGEFADQRFRFAAAVVPSQGRIYTFGGQLPFDFTCDCFPTSDHVGVGTEGWHEPHEDEKTEDNKSSYKLPSLGPGSIAAIVLGSVVGLALLLLILRWMLRKRSKEAEDKVTAEELEAKQDGEFVA